METKIEKYRERIAKCIEKNFDFTVPEEDGSKDLCGTDDAWNKLETIIKQILRDTT